MRLGVVGDIHWNVDPNAPPQFWHNSYEPEALERRLAEAVALFAREEVQLAVFLGDLSDLGDEASLDEVLARVPGPLAVVAGNHDGDRDALERTATRHTTTLLDRHAVTVDDVMILGIGAEAAETGRPRSRSVRPAIPDVGTLLVVASHFPLLSEAGRLAEAGLPYPGDLVDGEVVAKCVAKSQPALVLSGHVHARCTRTHGALLQLSVGALIEPPFDAAIVDVALGPPPTVHRRSHRLGPVAAFEPVFAPEEEQWEWTGTEWQARLD